MLCYFNCDGSYCAYLSSERCVVSVDRCTPLPSQLHCTFPDDENSTGAHQNVFVCWQKEDPSIFAMVNDAVVSICSISLKHKLCHHLMPGRIAAVDWKQSGNLLAVCSLGEIELFSYSNNKLSSTRKITMTKPCSTIFFHNDFLLCASASIVVYDSKSGEIHSTYIGHTSNIDKLDVISGHKKYSYIVSSSKTDAFVLVWKLSEMNGGKAHPLKSFGCITAPSSVANFAVNFNTDTDGFVFLLLCSDGLAYLYNVPLNGKQMVVDSPTSSIGVSLNGISIPFLSCHLSCDSFVFACYNSKQCSFSYAQSTPLSIKPGENTLTLDNEGATKVSKGSAVDHQSFGVLASNWKSAATSATPMIPDKRKKSEPITDGEPTSKRLNMISNDRMSTEQATSMLSQAVQSNDSDLMEHLLQTAGHDTRIMQSNIDSLPANQVPNLLHLLCKKLTAERYAPGHVQQQLTGQTLKWLNTLIASRGSAIIEQTASSTVFHGPSATLRAAHAAVAARSDLHRPLSQLLGRVKFIQSVRDEAGPKKSKGRFRGRNISTSSDFKPMITICDVEKSKASGTNDSTSAGTCDDDSSEEEDDVMKTFAPPSSDDSDEQDGNTSLSDDGSNDDNEDELDTE